MNVELYGNTDEPVYWQHEKSGQMKGIVQKFFDHAEITAEEFKILKWYVQQWINKTYLQVCKRMGDNIDKGYEKVMKNLASKVETINTAEALRDFVSGECLDAGIDPF